MMVCQSHKSDSLALYDGTFGHGSGSMIGYMDCSDGSEDGVTVADCLIGHFSRHYCRFANDAGVRCCK